MNCFIVVYSRQYTMSESLSIYFIYLFYSAPMFNPKVAHTIKPISFVPSINNAIKFLHMWTEPLFNHH